MSRARGGDNRVKCSASLSPIAASGSPERMLLANGPGYARQTDKSRPNKFSNCSTSGRKRSPSWVSIFRTQRRKDFAPPHAELEGRLHQVEQPGMAAFLQEIPKPQRAARSPLALRRSLDVRRRLTFARNALQAEPWRTDKVAQLIHIALTIGTRVLMNQTSVRTSPNCSRQAMTLHTYRLCAIHSS
jgi:hypothetical protein